MRKVIMILMMLFVCTASSFAAGKKTTSKAADDINDSFSVVVIPIGTMPPLLKGLSAEQNTVNVKKIDESMTKTIDNMQKIKSIPD